MQTMSSKKKKKIEKVAKYTIRSIQTSALNKTISKFIQYTNYEWN